MRSEYLGFALDGEAYAVQMAHLAEVLKPLPITEVPRAPRNVLGLVSVRGKLVAVVDLRRRLRLPEAPVGRKTRILLVDVDGSEQMGLLVDEVREVLRLSEGEIEPPAAIGGDQPAHVMGIARPGGPDGEVVILLDLKPIVEWP